MLLSVLVMAAAVAPAQPVKLASTGLRVVDIAPERGAFYAEQVVTTLIARGFRVVSEREIATLIGLERQKQLLGGCADDASACLIELASALGTDGVVVGDVAKIGQRFQASLRIVDAGTGATLAVHAFKADTEEALVDGLVQGAQTMGDALLRTLGRAPAASVSAGGIPVARAVGWAPVALGVLAAGAGVGAFVVSRDDYAKLDPAMGARGRLTVAEATAIAGRGDTLQTAGVALMVAGGVVAVAGATVLLFGRSAQVHAVVTPGGAGLGLAGTFP